MMSHSRRQILTPGPTNNKRKDRGEGLKPSAITTKSLAKPSIHRAPTSVKSPQPTCNNQLLAGYLAHEFIAKGTLFGEPWDPDGAEGLPVSGSAARAAYSGRGKPFGEKRKAEPSGNTEKQLEKHQRYQEVADLLKADGVHIPGIVNPLQLARFLQLG